MTALRASPALRASCPQEKASACPSGIYRPGCRPAAGAAHAGAYLLTSDLRTSIYLRYFYPCLRSTSYSKKYFYCGLTWKTRCMEDARQRHEVQRMSIFICRTRLSKYLNLVVMVCGSRRGVGSPPVVASLPAHPCVGIHSF